MLVKDWLSIIVPASNIKVIDGNTTAYGTKESIKENYGDFDLKRVEQVDDTDLLIFYVSTKCPHYKVLTVRHLTGYENGYYPALYADTHIEYTDKEESYCFGTKNSEICHCGGDKRKCNFYHTK